jgi:hypothetical protein
LSLNLPTEKIAGPLRAQVDALKRRRAGTAVKAKGQILKAKVADLQPSDFRLQPSRTRAFTGELCHE